MTLKNNAYTRIAEKYSPKPIHSFEDVNKFFDTLGDNFSQVEIEVILADLTDDIYNKSHIDDYEEYERVDYPQFDDEIEFE